MIEMIPFTKDHVIPCDGKYLVKTQTTQQPRIQYLQVTCKVVNGKTTIDVSNQVILEISKDPLNTFLN